MVVAGDFKNGLTFDMDGVVYQVIEFQHVKPGKGAAFVRAKIKNCISGGVTERTFNPTDKFENAYIERKDMQYSYDDGDLSKKQDSLQLPIFCGHTKSKLRKTCNLKHLVTMACATPQGYFLRNPNLRTLRF